MTYNIHQGTDLKGTSNINRIVAQMDKYNVDIMGYQESDTVKLFHGNKYLNSLLTGKTGWYNYAGPSPSDSTGGCSILSKYKIEETNSYLLPSTYEQATAINIIVSVPQKGKINIWVVHFGQVDSDRLAQASALVKLISLSKIKNIILIGDFNSHYPSAPMDTIYQAINQQI